jgi:hypothetical protein
LWIAFALPSATNEIAAATMQLNWRWFIRTCGTLWSAWKESREGLLRAQWSKAILLTWVFLKP